MEYHGIYNQQYELDRTRITPHLMAIKEEKMINHRSLGLSYFWDKPTLGFSRLDDQCKSAGFNMFQPISSDFIYIPSMEKVAYAWNILKSWSHPAKSSSEGFDDMKTPPLPTYWPSFNKRFIRRFCNCSQPGCSQVPGREFASACDTKSQMLHGAGISIPTKLGHKYRVSM